MIGVCNWLIMTVCPYCLDSFVSVSICFSDAANFKKRFKLTCHECPKDSWGEQLNEMFCKHVQNRKSICFHLNSQYSPPTTSTHLLAHHLRSHLSLALKPGVRPRQLPELCDLCLVTLPVVALHLQVNVGLKTGWRLAPMLTREGDETQPKGDNMITKTARHSACAHEGVWGKICWVRLPCNA
jgi:hypothetical protein